jgi:tetratricopeptide (TPR) repeat protein
MTERDIFIAALQKEGRRERQAYLEEVCAGQPGLQQQVEGLLGLYENAGSFLENPVEEVAAMGALFPAPDGQVPGGTEQPGMVLTGRYKLLEATGEGGMGTVWMARQTEPVKRLVAVKLIKPGMDSKQVLARFEAERQALALMDHPHIAKVLDAGAAPDGRPFFVMELVKGVPLTTYCDERRLTPRQRLELFVPVCQAVQHAHHKGIIHRDLKPSNVLVALYDDKPVVKVIDFGVAKATGQQLTEESVHTGFGAVVGTVEYMSPEQATLNQLDVDTRSDVYSLGVLLYELLTGTTPLEHQRVQEAGILEALRLIREEEAPTLSQRLSTTQEVAAIAARRSLEPAKLTRLVKGELDWIVRKALEKERNRRYETANAFALDVQRYLADQPVQACPPSAAYRFLKFARRKKTGLVFSGLVALVLLTLAGSLGWIVRDRAARQMRLAEQVELILEEADQRIKAKKWQEALATAKRAEATLASGNADARTQQRVRQVLADLELVRELEEARLLKAQITDGHFNDIGAERAYSRAFANAGLTVEGLTVEQAARQFRARSGIVTELAIGLTEWAVLRRPVKGEGDDTTWRHLLAVADAIDPDPWRRQLRAAWQAKEVEVKSLRELARSPDTPLRPPSTVVLLANLLLKREAPDEAVNLLLKVQQQRPGNFWINFKLANCLATSTPKRLDEAATFYRIAVALRPSSPAVRNNLGNVLSDQGKLDEAIACYQKAIALDPKFALAHNNLGSVLSDQGKLDEASAYLRKAIEVDPTHPAAQYNLGNVLSAQGKLDEAIACYRKVIELDPKNADVHYNLGNTLQNKGQIDQAIVHHHKAIELDPKNAGAHNNLGNALQTKGQLDEAIDEYRKAIQLDPKDAGAHHNLGVALKAKRQLEEAIAEFRKAITLDPKHAAAHYHLGSVLSDQGKPDEAIVYLRKAIELDPTHPAAHYNLGNALKAKGQLEEAIAEYSKAIELNPKDAAAHNNLGNALADQKKFDQAFTHFREAIRLKPDHACTYHNLGRALRAQGHLDAAIEAFKASTRYKPNHAQHHSDLGNALWRKGLLDEAIRAYCKAIELDPTDAVSHYALGLLFAKKHAWNDAITAYREALCLQPDKAEIHYNLGVALFHGGRLNDAIAEYRETIRLNPDHIYAHNNLGIALKAKGQLEEAIAEYRKAIQLDPDYAFAHNNLGVALKARGQLEEAIFEYRKAIALDPNYAAAHNNLAVALKAKGQLEEAIAEYRKAIALNPKDASAHNNLGVALQAQGKLDEAIDAFKEAVRLRPSSHNACVNLAWILATCADESLRNPAEAIKYARKAIELRPTHANNWSNLGVAEYRAGNWNNALEWLEKANAMRGGKDHWHRFFLAMARWRTGDTAGAQKAYADAVRWMEADPKRSQDAKLRRFRREAEELLGIRKDH